jgi:molecular chaperone GrpE
MTDHKHKKDHNPTPPEPPKDGTPPPNDGKEQPVEPQAPMVALSMEEYSQMQADLKKAQEESKEFLDGWQRERAEFANFRRRMERDALQQTQSITGQVIKRYLVIIDDMERALKARPQEGEGASWSEGVELILRKLQGILEAEGVQRVPAEGPFNPTLHEALTNEDNPAHKSGEIIEVIQQGYMIGDRVLRPALVRVAR